MWIKRENGRIVELLRWRGDRQDLEEIADDHAEVTAFLSSKQTPNPTHSDKRQRERSIQDLEKAVAGGDQQAVNTLVLQLLKGN